MKAPTEKPKVKLIGTNGDAFAIIGKVSKALRKAGADKEYVEKYMEESMAGDYDNVLVTAVDYVDVH